MKNISLFIILISQIFFCQDNMGGQPYSLKHNLSIDPHPVTMKEINIDNLLEQDSNAPPASPFRYGHKFNVDFSLNNSGYWSELENGDRIWRLTIQTKDAYAICLEYDQFYLPNGSNFFVYNDKRDMIAGAYTSDNNQTDMLFATPLITQLPKIVQP